MAAADEPARAFKYGVPGEQTPATSLEVRENFRGLAQNFYTTDGAYPTNPRAGQFRVLASNPANVKLQVWIGTAWQTLAQNIQVGVPVPDKTIVSSFQTPPGANPWVIDHNLGSPPVVQVYASPAPFRLLEQVSYDDRRYMRFLGRLPTAGLVAGVVRSGLALPHNGDILRTFAICETPVGGPVDFTIAFTLDGSPLSPEGDIVVAGALARGDEVTGTPIGGGNGAHVAGGTLDIDAIVNTPPPDGAVELYAEVNRTLAPNEYRVEHVTDDRVQITFAQDTSGIALLLG